MKASIGLTEKEFFEKFSKYLKRIYWPEIATRSEPADIGKRLTNHEKDHSNFNEKPTSRRRVTDSYLLRSQRLYRDLLGQRH